MKKNSIVIVVRYLIVIVVKQKSLVSVVKDLVLIVVKLKPRSQRNQRFLLNSSEVRVVSVPSEEKQRSYRSQISKLSSSEVKQRGDWNQRFPFNSTEVKQPSERTQGFTFNSCEGKQRSVVKIKHDSERSQYIE